MNRTGRIVLNVVLPPLIAAFFWALLECAHHATWLDLPAHVMGMALYAYLFSGFFCSLHAALMEVVYLRYPPAHPFAILVSSGNGFLAGATLSYLLTRDIFGSAAHLPLAVLGLLTGLLLGLLLAALGRHRLVTAAP